MNAARREGTISFRWRCCRVEANPELLPTQAVAKESTLLELPSPTIELLPDSSALSAVGSEVSQAWKIGYLGRSSELDETPSLLEGGNRRLSSRSQCINGRRASGGRLRENVELMSLEMQPRPFNIELCLAL
jgi:hypothetical protein